MPEHEPVARQVLLWVGVTDVALREMRRRLPEQTITVLHNADAGTPTAIRMRDRYDIPPVVVSRIRYDGVALGYGVLLGEWMTIANKSRIPGHYIRDIEYASSVLRALKLFPVAHLTDRP